MKPLSWILTLLLTGLLIFGFLQIPAPGEGFKALSTHIGSRYQQKSEAETGIRFPAAAVLADYRGFDLLACGLLFSLAGFALLFFFQQQPRFKTLSLSLLTSIGGLSLCLGLGLVCLRGGSNFLDYEALTFYFPSDQARWNGTLILFGGVLISCLGLVGVLVRWLRTREGIGGR